MLTIAVISWFVCGFISSGYSWKYFRTEYSVLYENRQVTTEEKLWFGLFVLAGPNSLIANFLIGHNKHGWQVPFTEVKVK